MSILKKCEELMPEEKLPFVIKENPPSDKAIWEMAFNQARTEMIKVIPSLINLIREDTIKVIRDEIEKYEPAYESEDQAIVRFGRYLLSTLSKGGEKE